MKVMVVFGTRPEAIKMCPVLVQLQKCKEIQTTVVLTGQHREMLDQVMQVFGMEANYNLALMKNNQTLADITVGVLQGVSELLERECPDIVLVHGDTTTSFAAGLASFYQRIPIAHVEAGLRTNDFSSPFPEEYNRQSVDLISELYFAPTNQAKENLLKEGKASKKIYVTGNTVIDALNTTIKDDYSCEILEWAKDSRMILLTAHRRENIGEAMRSMFEGICRIIEEYEDVKVIYPIHMNPKVRQIAQEVFGDMNRIRMIEPLDVVDFHNFMKKSYLILTDSGGIQEEAPALGKPVLVMRNSTERPEGVEAGTLRLIGPETDAIYSNTKILLDNFDEYKKMSTATNPYGDGHASERITEALLEWYNKM